MKLKKLIALLIVFATVLSVATGCKKSDDDDSTDEPNEESSLLLHYSLDEADGSLARESVSGVDYTVNYVFNEQNADTLFKEPNDPLRRTGVKGNALYREDAILFVIF